MIGARGNCKITLQVSKDHRVSIRTSELLATKSFNQVIVTSPILTIQFDQHDIFTFQDVKVCSIHHGSPLRLVREGFHTLEQPTNRAWEVSFARISINFPYGYKFSACLEQVLNMNKWRKLVHKVNKPPFTGSSPLPPDICIKIKTLTVQLSDDPFEVSLCDNYELMADESSENEKRRDAMDRRVQELRKKYGLLPASKLEELYASLCEKSAQVYIKRWHQLYAAAPMRERLFFWAWDNIEITSLADPTLHGKDNVVANMMQIDPESPYPEEGLEFVTLWCRMVNVSVQGWQVHLKDFRQPVWEVQDFNLWGRLIGAEQKGSPRGAVCL